MLPRKYILSAEVDSSLSDFTHPLIPTSSAPRTIVQTKMCQTFVYGEEGCVKLIMKGDVCLEGASSRHRESHRTEAKIGLEFPSKCKYNLASGDLSFGNAALNACDIEVFNMYVDWETFIMCPPGEET